MNERRRCCRGGARGDDVAGVRAIICEAKCTDDDELEAKDSKDAEDDTGTGYLHSVLWFVYIRRCTIFALFFIHFALKFMKEEFLWF